MVEMKYLKQVRIVNQDSQQRYLKDFFEEPLTFEEYMNFELGQMIDNLYANLLIL